MVEIIKNLIQRRFYLSREGEPRKETMETREQLLKELEVLATKVSSQKLHQTFQMRQVTSYIHEKNEHQIEPF